MPRSYHNLMPGLLESELRAAHRVGVVPVEVPGTAFDALATESATMIYVVVDDRLLVSKRSSLGAHLTHAVLASGGPVQAAGEFEVERHRHAITVTMLNDMSGHYRPGSESLEVARQAFESRGIRVRPGSARSYHWRAS